MKYLYQRDPKWAGITLGSSNRTLAQVGCTTTCISMSSDYFGCYLDPGSCAKRLSYTDDARILWGSIGTTFLTMAFLWREYKYNQPLISEAIKNPAKTCLLNVNNGGHWVLALKELGFGKYWVCDPWDGNRKIYSGVVGCSVLKMK